LFSVGFSAEHFVPS